MPRYYFHIRDGENLVRDEEGLSLADPMAARIEAHASARDIARQSDCGAANSFIEVADQSGTVLERVLISSPH